jgi:hypothetical protein
MEYSIGIDPDVTRPSVALVRSDGAVIACDCIKVKIPAGTRGGNRLLFTMLAIRGHLGTRDWHLRYGKSISISHLVVEGQGIWNNEATPDSILKLGIVAGMCMGIYSQWFNPSFLYLPGPVEWKKGVPKHIHQARLCTELGWAFEKHGTGKGRYCQPLAPVVAHHIDFNPGDWKHVLDAIGLARYAFDHESALARRRARQ